jgi:hypothetical protein
MTNYTNSVDLDSYPPTITQVVFLDYLPSGFAKPSWSWRIVWVMMGTTRAAFLDRHAILVSSELGDDSSILLFFHILILKKVGHRFFRRPVAHCFVVVVN